MSKYISLFIVAFAIILTSLYMSVANDLQDKKNFYLRESHLMLPDTQTQEEKWAVLIGIDKYEDTGIGMLRFTSKDAQALYEILTKSSGGFKDANVVLLTSQADKPEHYPKRNNIIAILSSWLSLAKENDTVLLYFSGHGIEQEGKSYILPQDARTANLALTALEVNYLKDALRTCKAKKRILILDACHSGSEKSANIMGRALANTLSEAEGMVILASCDLNEQSFEMNETQHGAFTYYLIEALKGNADRDGDGLLWASEVNYYVWDKTRKWAAKNGLKQTPKYISAVTGEIVLAQVTKSSESEKQSESPVLVNLEKSESESKLEENQEKDDMILIPAGKFIMGSNSDERDEFPQREVYQSSFYVDKYEVTNSQYKDFLDYIIKTSDHSKCYGSEPKNYDHIPTYWNDSIFNHSKLPVVGVSWYDAYAYASWAGKRLPTESEWEKAARGDDGRKYPWGNNFPNYLGKFYANYDPGKASADGYRYTAPVGSFHIGASPYGVMDMSGNVWEFVADWYGSYEKAGGDQDPKGPNSGVYRALRGGSWINDQNSLRCSYRINILPTTRSLNIGFRCAKDVNK